MNDDIKPQTDEPEIASQRIEKSRMGFLQHLNELRRRLLIISATILAGGIVAWIFYHQILDFLVKPYCDVVDPAASGIELGQECLLLVTDPLEPLSVRFMIAIYAGIALAMPMILYQLWRFVVPGLYKKERNYTTAFVVAAVLLFAAGVILAFFTVPRALDFLTSIGGDDLANFFSPKKYLDFLVKMMIAFGLGFEFPVVLVFLQLIGILKYKTLNKFRPYAVVGLVILAAILTPSGDPVTLIVLSVPLYIFYEVSFLIGWLIQRKRVDLDSGSKKSRAKI